MSMTGPQLQRFRQSRGFTQEQLAHELKITSRHLLNLEAGRRSRSRPGDPPLLVDRVIELACAAIALGVREFDGQSTIATGQPPLRPRARPGRKPREAA